ncbi:hypothetical protein HYV89_04685 [Candidatus Woesearchaeota archaeon]|nr:hypothetical protein [Candidatus Woesearchaeota archaeon]
MKYEKIYREILIGALERRERFTQLELSKKCALSLGFVNKIIKRLAEIGAVDIQRRGFRIIDSSKILFDWASKRRIKKEVSESYCIDMNIGEIEKSLPFIFTAYSAWRLLMNSMPFDYDEVYIYVPIEGKKLFRMWLKDKPAKKRKENLFVIFTDDDHLIKNSKNKIAPLPQIFVDTYNLGSIASKYFIKEMLDKYPIFKVEA